MSVTRRHVIRIGQTLLASAALPLKLIGGEQFANGSRGAGDSLSRALFQPLVNSAFSVRKPSGESTWFTLMSVEDTSARTPAYLPRLAVQPPPSGPSQATDSFALHFYCVDEALAQDTYQLEHANTGRFELFVVPSGRSRYTAIVNHLQGFIPGMPVPVRRKRPSSTPAEAETLVP